MFAIIGIVVVVGYLAARVIPGEGSDFILEIPPLRLPQFTNVIVKTLARIEWYLKEAVPLFILSARLMNTSGVTTRLFNFATTIVGFLPGGLFDRLPERDNIRTQGSGLGIHVGFVKDSTPLRIGAQVVKDHHLVDVRFMLA